MNMPYVKSRNYLGAAAITSVHSMASILLPTCSSDSCSNFASINVYFEVECLAGSYGEAMEANPITNAATIEETISSQIS